MLPFDLHVLGMPPAFNLSQDQTLHLKLQMTEAINLLSESFESQASLLTLGIQTLLQLDSSSLRRRPHKLPAHTVKDRYGAEKPEPRSARFNISSKRAAHLTSNFASVNTSRRTFFPNPRTRQLASPPRRAGHYARRRMTLQHPARRKCAPHAGDASACRMTDLEAGLRQAARLITNDGRRTLSPTPLPQGEGGFGAQEGAIGWREMRDTVAGFGYRRVCRYSTC